MPKVIWQTEFEKRTFLLLLCKAHMLHKYYLASPCCILCARCFIIIAIAISIKMLFSRLFFPCFGFQILTLFIVQKLCKQIRCCTEYVRQLRSQYSSSLCSRKKILSKHMAKTGAQIILCHET